MAYTVTLVTLLASLRNRLNDGDSGNYTDAELTQCINTAYHEWQMVTRCYEASVAITIVNGTATYATLPLFEIVAVYMGGEALEKSNLEDIANLDEVSLVATGTPTHWWVTTGRLVRLYPIPAALDPIPACTAYGYGVADALTGSEAPAALPPGFDQHVLLDRAEAEARKMRASYAGNAGLVAMLMQKWAAALGMDGKNGN